MRFFEGFDVLFAGLAFALMVIIIMMNLFIYFWLFQYKDQAVHFVDLFIEWTDIYEEDKKLFQENQLKYQIKLDNFIKQYEEDKEEFTNHNLKFQKQITEDVAEIKGVIVAVGTMVAKELKVETGIIIKELDEIQNTLEIIADNTTP